VGGFKMSEELNNEQVEMEENNRLTKTEWEKIEIIGKTVDDLKIRNLKSTLYNTLALIVEVGTIGYLYSIGATDDLNHFLLCSIPMFGIGYAPYLKNVKKYFELKKDYKHELEIYESKNDEEEQGMKL
jgi:hypothetical protein